ncbi:MAG: LLM class flavin-dependent oxidoreductase [Actinomycetota bacterium]
MERIPDPALVVLVGASGSGKSTWAANHFRPDEVVSSDRLRAMVGSGEHDLDASPTAFSLLDQIVEARLSRRLLTVVDTLGLDDERRTRHLARAVDLGLPAVLVVFDLPEEMVRHRNRQRRRPVPAAALTSQLRRFRQIRPRLVEEGWRLINPVGPVRVAPAHAVRGSQPPSRPGPGLLRFYLQISRFPAKGPLGPWLAEVAGIAERVGFSGLAMMDHLIQIPQVGRPWEDMPEPFTSLGFLAGVTGRLELGTLVTGVTLRNPALLAKIVATLDVVSGGRAFCGLGAGWFESEKVSYGYEPATASRRLDMLEDALHILPLMWGPGTATYRGKVTSVTEAVCYPRPSHPVPIIVGGAGARTVSLACRLADGLNIVGVDRLLTRIENVRHAVAQAGRDRSTFSISALDTPLLGKDRAEVAELVETHRGRVPATTFAVRHHAGEVTDHVDRFQALAGAGCDGVFLAPVGLSHPEAVGLWEGVIAAAKQAPVRA